tara:strand:+ start:278 stop:547 length:270 start_codon:yes stop_codon:yes gene_type:complete
MRKQEEFNDEVLKEKLKVLLDDDIQPKRWNEGLLIKSLILLPIIIFTIGLFVVNSPKNLIEVLFIFIYLFSLIALGLIILYFMRSKFYQ